MEKEADSPRATRSALIWTGERGADAKVSLFFERIGWSVKRPSGVDELCEILSRQGAHIAVIGFGPGPRSGMARIVSALKRSPSTYLTLVTETSQESIGMRKLLHFHPKILSIRRASLVWAIDLLISSESVGSPGAISEELGRRAKFLNAIFDSIDFLADDSESEIQAKLGFYLEKALASVGSESGSIMLTDGRANLIVWAATSSEMVGQRFPVRSESPVSIALRSKRAVWAERSGGDDPADGESSDEPDISITIPILFEGRALGAMNIVKTRDPGALGAEETRALSIFSGMAVAALMASRARRASADLKAISESSVQLNLLKESRAAIRAREIQERLDDLIAHLHLLDGFIIDDEIARLSLAGARFAAIVAERIARSFSEDDSNICMPRANPEPISVARLVGRLEKLSSRMLDGRELRSRIDPIARSTQIEVDHQILCQAILSAIRFAADQFVGSGAVELEVRSTPESISFRVRYRTEGSLFARSRASREDEQTDDEIALAEETRLWDEPGLAAGAELAFLRRLARSIGATARRYARDFDSTVTIELEVERSSAKGAAPVQ